MENKLIIISKMFHAKHLNRYKRVYNINKTFKIEYQRPTRVDTITIFLEDLEVKKYRLWLNKAEYNLQISNIITVKEMIE